MSYTRGIDHSKALVGLVGLEPTTSCSQSTRATKLRHSPNTDQGTSDPDSVPPHSYVGTVEVGTEFQARIDSWDTSSRWERSELGKDLRRLGLSYGEIMDLIPVVKSTLATWCRDVRLSDEQYEAIRQRTGSREGIPRDTNRKRRQEIELLVAQANLEAMHLQDDPFWMAGVVLYWSEGCKTNRRLEMAHSEPEALRLLMKWARTFVDPNATFAAAINLHFDNDEAQARRYWSTQLGIDLASFTKTFVKPDGTGHRKNHLAHGVCRVSMRKSTDAFLTTMAWIGFVKDDWQSVDLAGAAGATGSAVDS